MANWEYKVISSGKGGFATPALMEKFINDLGQEQWEIINFHTAPDNPLAFTGLARRTTLRDWTLEDAAAAAARAETDKLRAEFEAKFKGMSQGAPAATEEKAETLIDAKAAPDDGFRRPVDTSRDDDPDAPQDDEWHKLTAEDELPTFFDALKPHMRRNQRGPGMSVGIDMLAKKWRLEEGDIKTALVECGMQIPSDENAKPVYVEYDGDLFWVNINRRGETWINVREKPEPVFRVVAGKRLSDEEAPQDHHQPPAQHQSRRDEPPAFQPTPRGAEAPAPAAQPPPAAPAPAAPKTLLGKLRGMMRRNHRGHGWSGSFPYLTKALKLDEAGLLAELAPFGVQLPPEGENKPVFATEGDFVYWLNKNQRGEIWINAQLSRDHARAMGGAPSPAPVVEAKAEAGAPVAETAPAAPAAPAPVAPPSAPAVTHVPEHTLTAMRLLMEPKKRGEGFTVGVKDVAAKLEKTDEQVLAALSEAGLNLPASAKDKPSFAEHNGDLFWLNANAKGQVWINAKPVSAKKSKAKKAAE
jgi:hypothetical protein